MVVTCLFWRARCIPSARPLNPMTQSFISCPWCTQRNPVDALTCRFCGGPLPSGDRLPSLPPPPRKLPKGYAPRLLRSRTEFTIGVVFIALGLPMCFIFSGIGLGTGIWLFLLIGGGLSSIFVLLGAGLLYFSWRPISRHLRCYRHGMLAAAEISDVFEDHSVVVNGQYPWVIRYQYRAAGQVWEGEERLERSLPESIHVGQKTHALYLPEAPGVSVLFPSLV